MLELNRVWLVAKREWSTRLKQRSFQVTTVIQILVVLTLALAPVIIARFAGDDQGRGSMLVVVDETDAGVAERLAPWLEGDGEALETIAVMTSAGTAGATRALVNEGRAQSALIVTRGNDEALSFTLITGSGDPSSAVQRIHTAASAIAMEERLIQSGISQEEAQQVFAPVVFDVEGPTAGQVDSGFVGSTEANAAEYAIAYISSILMFIAVVMYGTWIAQGVVEEKSSRIMEIMINAATPRDLLAGKVIGIMMAGLTQLLPMLLVGGLAFGFQPQIANLVGVNVEQVLDIDFGTLTIKAVGFFLLYFLLGFVLYGALYAGIGSLVSRQEEVSQAIAPMMTFMMIGYFGAFFVLGAPNTTVANWLMIFPLTSPFSAMPRILLGDPTSGQIVLSVVLLVLVAIFAIWLAGKLYRVGVLMYGQRPSWRSLLRTGRLQQVAR